VLFCGGMNFFCLYERIFMIDFFCLIVDDYLVLIVVVFVYLFENGFMIVGFVFDGWCVV